MLTDWDSGQNGGSVRVLRDLAYHSAWRRTGRGRSGQRRLSRLGELNHRGRPAVAFPWPGRPGACARIRDRTRAPARGADGITASPPFASAAVTRD